jgi:hypothetical protein
MLLAWFARFRRAQMGTRGRIVAMELYQERRIPLEVGLG